MFFGGDPFDQFPNGGMDGGPGGSASNVDTTKLYETLGVRGLMWRSTIGMVLNKK